MNGDALMSLTKASQEANENDKRHIGNATDKVMTVLEEASRRGGPHKLGDIAERARLGKASTHRLLADLTRLGFTASEGTGSYGPGPRLTALASSIRGDRRDDSVISILTALQHEVGQTVHLSFLAGQEAVYVHKIEPTQPFQMASRVGMRIPLYCTAVGKSILAFLDEGARDDYLESISRPPRTPNTLVTAEALRQDLLLVRARGYSVDDEENELKIRCIGAPLFGSLGQVIGGISVSTLTFELSPQDALALAPTVARTAAELTRIYSHSRGA